MSANPSVGFSIVSYTGTGANATVGHGLGAPADFIISKNLSGSFDWAVFHSGAQDSGAKSAKLDVTTTFVSDSTTWQNLAPTPTNFSVGTNPESNQGGSEHIAYCWSEIPGFSKFGSWTGDGNSVGPMVTTGFKPRFLLWKRADGVANWYIYDTERQSCNPLNVNLEPNTGDAERELPTKNIDFLSNGFQIKGTNGDVNANGSTYIYAAFAAKPL